MITNERKALVCLLIFSVFFLPLRLHGEGARGLQIQIGETKVVPVAGVAPFATDPSLLLVEELPPDRMRLTGLRGGRTQVLFWVGEELRQMRVEVVASPTLVTPGIGPRFRGNRPYFQYVFDNNSAFRSDQFFDSPSYAHTLIGTFPTAHGGSLRSLGRVSHQSEINDYQLRGGQLVYQDGRRRFTFGEANIAPTRVLTEVYGGASLLGSELQFRPNTEKGGHELTLFGGPLRPDDLKEPKFDDQLYGTNYTWSFYRSEALFPNFINVSPFAFQPTGTNSFEPAFVAEENYYLHPDFSVASGFAKGPGGVSGVLRPFWERENGITSGRYLYINHGLIPVGGNAFQNDEHRSQITHQQLAGNGRDLWNLGLSQNISLPKGGSTLPSSDSIGAQSSFRRSSSYRQGWGLNYNVGRSKSGSLTTLTNSVGGNLVYPAGLLATLNHALTYSRSDLDQNQQQVGFGTGLALEHEYYRSNTDLTLSALWGRDSREPLVLQETLSFSLGRQTIFQVGAGYQKTDLQDDTHRFQFSPVIHFQPTSVHRFSLNSSTSLLLEPDNRTFQGSLSINYQYYFGPGIERDPLWKRLVVGGKKAPVTGQLFWDANYNNYFDPNEKPVAKIPVTLDRKKTVSDEQGVFEFPRVREGEHELQVSKKLVYKQQELDYSHSQKFQTDGILARHVPIPIRVAKAEIDIRMLVDVNENQRADQKDEPYLLPKVILTDGHGEDHTVSMPVGGEIVKGIEQGIWTVHIDPLDVPDDVELQGEMAHEITVTGYKTYGTVFLFRPLRTFGGTVKVPPGRPLPKNLTLRLGPYESTVDRRGYFWFKQLRPGEYDLEMLDLPDGVCIDPRVPKAVTVPAGPFRGVQDIRLTTECSP